MTSVRLSLLLAAFALTLSLVACKPAQDDAVTETGAPSDATTQPQPVPASQHKTATGVTKWQCGKLVVSTHFDDDSLESITVETPERQLTLKSMANEEGARFADAAGNEFWSRPGKITFTQIGRPTIECTKYRG
jgi:hypothetical protein